MHIPGRFEWMGLAVVWSSLGSGGFAYAVTTLDLTEYARPNPSVDADPAYQCMKALSDTELFGDMFKKQKDRNEIFADLPQEIAGPDNQGTGVFTLHSASPEKFSSNSENKFRVVNVIGRSGFSKLFIPHSRNSSKFKIKGLARPQPPNGFGIPEKLTQKYPYSADLIIGHPNPQHGVVADLGIEGGSFKGKIPLERWNSRMDGEIDPDPKEANVIYPQWSARSKGIETRSFYLDPQFSAAMSVDTPLRDLTPDQMLLSVVDPALARMLTKGCEFYKQDGTDLRKTLGDFIGGEKIPARASASEIYNELKDHYDRLIDEIEKDLQKVEHDNQGLCDSDLIAVTNQFSQGHSVRFSVSWDIDNFSFAALWMEPFRPEVKWTGEGLTFGLPPQVEMGKFKDLPASKVRKLSASDRGEYERLRAMKVRRAQLVEARAALFTKNAPESCQVMIRAVEFARKRFDQELMPLLQHRLRLQALVRMEEGLTQCMNVYAKPRGDRKVPNKITELRSSGCPSFIKPAKSAEFASPERLVGAPSAQ